MWVQDQGRGKAGEETCKYEGSTLVLSEETLIIEMIKENSLRVIQPSLERTCNLDLIISLISFRKYAVFKACFKQTCRLLEFKKKKTKRERGKK